MNNQTKRAMMRANTYTTKQAMADLRTHMLANFSGSLATIAREGHPLAGYPVCSVVPFILDEQFRPVIMIAEIAEHTQNAFTESKASIFLRERHDGGDVQSQWRICMIGDLCEIDKTEEAWIARKYYAHYPKARDYDDMHVFHFFRLEVKKYRIIMGFGDIRWVAGHAPYTACPFDRTDKEKMMAHMNADHCAAMRHYLRKIEIAVGDDDAVEMVDLHHYGFVLRHGQHLHFLPFAEMPQDSTAVRKLLVAMAKA